jgi:hypothetical protein
MCMPMADMVTELRRTEFPVTAWPQLVELWLHTIRALPASKQ